MASEDMDRQIEMFVSRGDLGSAVTALRPVVLTVVGKFRGQIDRGDAIAICNGKALHALQRWDPVKGSARPYVAVAMERALLSELRKGRGRVETGDVEDAYRCIDAAVEAQWVAHVQADGARSFLPGYDRIMAMATDPQGSYRIESAVVRLIEAIAPVYAEARLGGEGVEWLDSSLRGALAT